MQARMKNPAFVVGGAMPALIALGTAAKQAGVPAETLDLVHLRASQSAHWSSCQDGVVTSVFGEIADVYDEVRPGYPAEIAAIILAYHGGVPAYVVELGAGTGKGTEVLMRLGAPLTCIEPDPRMATVLTAKFPRTRVYVGTFEEWTAPAGGVPMIACALAWQWLDETTRNQRAHASLASGGTLAVFGHRYGYADPAHALAIEAAFRSVDPGWQEQAEGWFHDDIAGSGLFSNVQAEVVRRQVSCPSIST
jgi:hypothetical protein